MMIKNWKAWYNGRIVLLLLTVILIGATASLAITVFAQDPLPDTTPPVIDPRGVSEYDWFGPNTPIENRLVNVDFTDTDSRLALAQYQFTFPPPPTEFVTLFQEAGDIGTGNESFTADFDVYDNAPEGLSLMGFRAEDKAGNVIDQPDFVLYKKDTLPPGMPSPTSAIVAPEPTNNTTPLITFDAVSDDNSAGFGSGVQRYEYQVDSTTGEWASLGFSLETNFEVAPPLADGLHEIFVRSVDNAENAGTPGSVSVNILTAPAPPDTDGDGIPDASDNCLNTVNPGQEDADSDGIGDACDNCPAVSNPDQADTNGNGIGDVCDAAPPIEQIPDLLTFPERFISLEDGENIRGMTSNDFTGDGKIDFAFVTSTGRLVLFENQRVVYSAEGVKSIEFARTLITELGEPAAGLASADFQFDGLPDVIVGTASGQVILFNNTDGTLSQSQSIVLFDAGDDAFGLTVGDVDTDGDFDIITGNKIGHVDFYVNTGSNSMSFTFDQTVTTRDQPYGLTTGDYDRDGHIDIMVGDRLGQLERIVFESGGYNGFLFADIGEFAHGLTTADIDYSGKLDLFALGFDGNISLYYARGNGLVAEPLIIGNKPQSAGLTAGDYDQDNDIDLIVGSDNGELTMLMNSLRIEKSLSPDPSPARRPITVETDVRNPYARSMVDTVLTEVWSAGTELIDNAFLVYSPDFYADVYFYDTVMDTETHDYYMYLDFPSKVYLKRCPAGRLTQCEAPTTFTYDGAGTLVGGTGFEITDIIDVFDHATSLPLREGFTMQYQLNSTTGETPLAAITTINYSLLGSFNTPPTDFLLSDDVSNLNNALANAKNLNPLPFKDDSDSAQAEIRLPDFTPEVVILSQPPIAPGDEVYYDVHVSNLNDIAIYGAKADIYEEDVFVGTQMFNVGASGTTRIIATGHFTATTETPSVRVVVNSGNVDLETDYTNNEDTASITISPFADLSIINVVTDKKTYLEGEALTVNVTVRNVGSVESPSAIVAIPSEPDTNADCGKKPNSLKLSCTPGSDEDLPVGDFCTRGFVLYSKSAQGIGVLQPGEEVTTSHRVQLGNLWAQSQGTFYISALVGNVGGTMKNIDEFLDNNVAYDPVPITVLPVPVDIQFDYPSGNKCQYFDYPSAPRLFPVNASAMRIEYDIRNIGGVDAVDFDNLVLLDNNDSLILGRGTIPVLGNHTGNIGFSAENAVVDWTNAPPGDHYVYVYLDYGRTTEESTAMATSSQGFTLTAVKEGVRGEDFILSIDPDPLGGGFKITLTENAVDVRQTPLDVEIIPRTSTYTIEKTASGTAIETISDLASVITTGGLDGSGSFVDISGFVQIDTSGTSSLKVLSSEVFQLALPGSLRESNEGGHRHKQAVLFRGVEISASNLVTSPDFPAPRDPVTLRATIRNTGDIPTVPFAVRLEVDGEIQEDQVISIGARGATDVTFNYIVPADNKIVHDLRIIADADNIILGEDEMNNIVVGELAVSADFELNILVREHGNNQLTATALEGFTPVTLGFEEVSMEYDASPAFFDYDRDGDLDILIGSLDGKILSLRNNDGVWVEEKFPAWLDVESRPPGLELMEEQTGSEFHVLADIDVGARSVPRFVDFENDGIEELVIGDAHGRVQVYHRVLLSIPGLGDVLLWNKTSDNLLEGLLRTTRVVPTFADLDGDSDLDLIVGDAMGSLHGFEQIDSTIELTYTENNWNLSGISISSNAAPFLFDLDSDGDQDLLLGGHEEIQLYENIGTLLEPTWQLVEDYANLISSRTDFNPIVVDANANGELEIVVGSNNLTQLPIRRGYFEPVNVQVVNYALNEMELNRISLSIQDAETGVILTHLYQDGPFQKILKKKNRNACPVVDTILTGYRLPAQDAIEKEYQLNIPGDLPNNTVLSVTADKLENVNPPFFHEWGPGNCGPDTLLSSDKGPRISDYNETLGANTFDVFVEEDMTYETNGPYRVFFNGTLHEEHFCNNDKFCPILDLTPGYVNMIVGGGDIIRHTNRLRTDFDIVDPEETPLVMFIENKFNMELKPGYIEDVVISLQNNNRRAFEIDRIAIELYDKGMPTGAFEAYDRTYNLYGNSSIIALFTDTDGFSIQPTESIIKTYKVYIPEGVPTGAAIVARAVEKHGFYDDQFARNSLRDLVPLPSSSTTFGPVITANLSSKTVYNSSQVVPSVDEALMGNYPYSFLVDTCDGCGSNPISCDPMDKNFLKKQFWIPQTVYKAEYQLRMTQICQPGVCFEQPSHVTSWVNGENKGSYTTECNEVQVGWTPNAQNLLVGLNNEFANYNFGPHRNLEYLFYEILAVDAMFEVVQPAARAIEVNVTSIGENGQLRRQFEEVVNMTFKNNDDEPRSIDVITFDLVTVEDKVIHLLTDTTPLYFEPGQASEKTFNLLIPSDVPLNSKLRVTAEHVFEFPDLLWLRDREMTQEEFLSEGTPDYHFGDTLPTQEDNLYRKHFFAPTSLRRAELILGDESLNTEAYLNGESQGTGYPGWSPMAVSTGFKEGANNLLSVQGTIPDTEARMYSGQEFTGGQVTDAEEDAFFTVFGVREENFAEREPFQVFPGEDITARIKVENKYNGAREFNLRLYVIDFENVQETTLKNVNLIVGPYETKQLEVDVTIPTTVSTDTKLQLENLWVETIGDRNWLRGSNFGDEKANQVLDDSTWGVVAVSSSENERAIYYRKHIWVDSITEKVKLRTSGVAKAWVNSLEVPNLINGPFFELNANQFTKSDDNLIVLKAENYDIDADVLLEHFVPVRSTDLEFFNTSISHCDSPGCSFNLTQGELITVNFSIRNAGELFSRDFLLQATIENMETGSIQKIVNEQLTMHPFSQDYWTITFNTEELAGDYKFSIVADTEDVIIETNEYNNDVVLLAYVNAEPRINYLDANDLQGYNEKVSMRIDVLDEDGNQESASLTILTPRGDYVVLPLTSTGSLFESAFNDSIPGLYHVNFSVVDELGLTASTTQTVDLFDTLYLNVRTTKDSYYLGQSVKLTGAADSGYEKIFINNVSILLNVQDDATLIRGGDTLTVRTNAIDRDGDALTLFVCDSSDGVSSNGCGSNLELCSATANQNPTCSFKVESDDQTHEWFAFVFDREGLPAIGNGARGNYTTDSIPPETTLFSIASSESSILDDQNDSKTIIVVTGNEDIQCRFGKDQSYRFHKDRGYAFLDDDCSSSGNVAVCNLGDVKENDLSKDPITNITRSYVSCIDSAGNEQTNEFNLDIPFQVQFSEGIFDDYAGSILPIGGTVTIFGAAASCVNQEADCAPIDGTVGGVFTFISPGVHYLRYLDSSERVRTTTVIVNTPPVIQEPVFVDVLDEHAFDLLAQVNDPDSQDVECVIQAGSESINSIVSKGLATARITGSIGEVIDMRVSCSDGTDSTTIETSHRVPNQAPVLVRLPDVSVNLGMELTLNLSTSLVDAEGDSAVFALSGSSSEIANLSIEGSSLHVRGLRVGTEELCVEASDLVDSNIACTRLFIENPAESKIKNNEFTNTTINLLLRVQFYDAVAGEWLDDSFEKRIEGKIHPGSINSVKLEPIFEEWQTTTSNYATQNFIEGKYRVIVEAVNDQEMALLNRDGAPMMALHEFTVINPQSGIELLSIPEIFLLQDEVPDTYVIDLREHATTSQDPANTQYEIVAQSNSALINCELINNSLVVCDPPASGQSGESIINVSVTDGLFKVENFFKITIVPLLQFENRTLVVECSAPLDANCQWQTQLGDSGDYTATVTATYGEIIVSKVISILVRPFDSIPPTTTAEGIDTTWHTEDISITLTAEDPVSNAVASGVAETYYQLYYDEVSQGVQSLSANGQPVITYEDDDNWIEYWSVDVAGNEEDRALVKGIKLDKTVPELTLSLDPSQAEYSVRESLPVIYSELDPVTQGSPSGIASALFNIDGVVVEDPTSIHDLLGTHTLTRTATDVAGNTHAESIEFNGVLGLSGDEEIKITPEVLKINPGVMTAHVNLPAPWSESILIEATLDGAPMDSISGDKNIKFRRDIVEAYLDSIGEPLDTHFIVRGTFNYNEEEHVFTGVDTLKEIKTSEEESKGGKGSK